jgi:hypothetical protein
MIALMQQFFLIPAFRRGILALQASDLPSFRKMHQQQQQSQAATKTDDEEETVTPEDDWLYQV